MQCSVNASKHALRGGLFVTRGAIDLPGKKQTIDGLGLKTAFQTCWVKVVVFDGVARTQDVRVLQPGHGAHQLVLNVKRQAGGDAVGVVLVGRQAFRLQKNLVAVFVGKAVDLVFHTGAIARANTIDLAREHGAAVKPAADDVVRALVGVGDPARHLLRVHVCAAHEAEDGDRLAVPHPITRLFQAFAEVNRTAIQTRWRAGLQAALRQFQFFEPGTERHRRRVTCPAGRVIVQPHMNLAIQECARRQHHRAASETDAHLGDGTDNAVALHHQVVHRLLKKPQVGLVLQHAADGRFVQNPVRLGAGSAHGRAFG